MSAWVPGPIVEVDGIRYYEVTGYGLQGRLLLQTDLVDQLSDIEYDTFIDHEIAKELERQRLRKEMHEAAEHNKRLFGDR